MKITVFTGNQPRHLSLIKELSKIASEVYAVIECNTIFTGKTSDQYKKTDTMFKYFENVLEAEHHIFGNINFLGKNVRPLVLKSGDVSGVPIKILKPALDSEYYIVFGASYIKGPLVDFLVKNKALNVHIGISPYYRGSACNFWALYDNRPEYVGATIHMLSKGLDSGEILFHALPSYDKNFFYYTMKAVRSAHIGLIKHLVNKDIFDFPRVKQERSLELRYSKGGEFTDKIAEEFMSRKNIDFEKQVKERDLSKYINPHIT